MGWDDCQQDRHKKVRTNHIKGSNIHEYIVAMLLILEKVGGGVNDPTLNGDNVHTQYSPSGG